eukprot:1443572-Prymnesium_polylepis.1
MSSRRPGIADGAGDEWTNLITGRHQQPSSTMGGKNSGKRKAAPAAAPKPLPAEGAAHKRTPQSNFDAAAGKDTYEPERVVAERLAKGVTQYQVKWAGFDAKHNTWEPIEHLAGCEDLIADMKERKKQRDAELEAAA